MASSLVRRIVTGTSLGLGVAVLLFLSATYPELPIPWLAALVLSVLGALELGCMGKLRELRLGLPLVLACGGGALVISLGPESHVSSYWLAYAAAGVLALGTVLGRRMLGAPAPPGALAWTLGLALWATVALYGVVVLHAWWGVSGLLAFLVLCKIGDIFGYFVGRAIGKRHPFPTISPNKTTAGCVASLVAGVVAGVLLAVFGLLPVSTGSPGAQAWLGGLIAGAILNLSSQAGDLLESWVKRSAGVKDSGTVFGPAGGVLDVVDSLLTSAPVAVLLWTLWFTPGPADS